MAARCKRCFMDALPSSKAKAIIDRGVPPAGGGRRAGSGVITDLKSRSAVRAQCPLQAETGLTNLSVTHLSDSLRRVCRARGSEFDTGRRPANTDLSSGERENGQIAWIHQRLVTSYCPAGSGPASGNAALGGPIFLLFHATASANPEPSSLLLAGLSLAGLIGSTQVRRSRSMRPHCGVLRG